MSNKLASSNIPEMLEGSQGYKCTTDEASIPVMALVGESWDPYVDEDEVLRQEVQQLKYLQHIILSLNNTCVLTHSLFCAPIQMILSVKRF